MIKKEEHAAKTKQKICDAFLQCLRTDPFKKITVKKIIEKACINRSTFYKYFLDKFDLLDFFINRILNDFRSQMNYDFIKARKDEINQPIYNEYFRNFEDFIRKNCKVYKILWNSEIEIDLYQKMLDIQRTNILNAICTDPYYTEDKYAYAVLYADLFANNFMLTINWWILNSDSIEFEKLSNIMKGNMEKGFFQTFRDIIEAQ